MVGDDIAVRISLGDPRGEVSDGSTAGSEGETLVLGLPLPLN
jgi:hypothetical protein